ncbi:chitin synthase chs-2 isoform X2, partial [Biomphalaria glabrata]
IFWIPGYNGVVLDIFLLLNRKQTLEKLNTVTHPVIPIKVFICTTMFREDEREIKQLLESLAKMKSKNNIKFESHIFFDAGVSNGKLSYFPLILFSLIPSTL